MTAMSEPASKDLVSTGYALIGELSANLIKAPIQLLLLWLTTLTPLVRPQGFGQLVGLTLAGTAFATFLSFCATRAFEVRAGRSGPGGWGYAIVPTVLEPIGGFLAGWLVSRDLRIAIAEGVVFAVVALVFFFIGKPWVPGMTSAEVHARIQETKEMTKEHFAEDIDKIRTDSRRINKERWERQKARRRPDDE